MQTELSFITALLGQKTISHNQTSICLSFFVLEQMMPFSCTLPVLFVVLFTDTSLLTVKHPYFIQEG